MDPETDPETDPEPETMTDMDNTPTAETGLADPGKKLELGGETAVTTTTDRKTTWLENGTGQWEQRRQL